ncbi:MAG: hypothetical protein ABID40_04900 [Candidatus Bipolaricaulota bacterium]
MTPDANVVVSPATSAPLQAATGVGGTILLQYPFISTGATVTLAGAPFGYTIDDAWVECTGGGGASAQLQTPLGAANITDAMVCAVAGVVSRAATLANRTVAAITSSRAVTGHS